MKTAQPGFAHQRHGSPLAVQHDVWEVVECTAVSHGGRPHGRGWRLPLCPLCGHKDAFVGPTGRLLCYGRTCAAADGGSVQSFDKWSGAELPRSIARTNSWKAYKQGISSLDLEKVWANLDRARATWAPTVARWCRSVRSWPEEVAQQAARCADVVWIAPELDAQDKRLAGSSMAAAVRLAAQRSMWIGLRDGSGELWTATRRWTAAPTTEPKSMRLPVGSQSGRCAVFGSIPVALECQVVWLVEGEMDYLAAVGCAPAGVAVIGAPGSSRLVPVALELAERAVDAGVRWDRVILAAHGDDPGRRGMNAAAIELRRASWTVAIWTASESTDLADLVRDAGVEEVRDVFSKADGWHAARLDDVRAQLPAQLATALSRSGVTLLAAPTGAGKTFAAVDVVAEWTRNEQQRQLEVDERRRTLLWTAPTRELADRTAQSLRDAGAVRVERMFSPNDVDIHGEIVCIDPDGFRQASAITGAGISFCNRCALAKNKGFINADCGYRRCRRDIVGHIGLEPAIVIVATLHSAVYYPAVTTSDSTLAVWLCDESPVSVGVGSWQLNQEHLEALAENVELEPSEFDKLTDVLTAVGEDNGAGVGAVELAQLVGTLDYKPNTEARESSLLRSGKGRLTPPSLDAYKALVEASQDGWSGCFARRPRPGKVSPSNIPVLTVQRWRPLPNARSIVVLDATGDAETLAAALGIERSGVAVWAPAVAWAQGSKCWALDHNLTRSAGEGKLGRAMILGGIKLLPAASLVVLPRALLSVIDSHSGRSATYFGAVNTVGSNDHEHREGALVGAQRVSRRARVAFVELLCARGLASSTGGEAARYHLETRPGLQAVGRVRPLENCRTVIIADSRTAERFVFDGAPVRALDALALAMDFGAVPRGVKGIAEGLNRLVTEACGVWVTVARDGAGELEQRVVSAGRRNGWQTLCRAAGLDLREVSWSSGSGGGRVMVVWRGDAPELAAVVEAVAEAIAAAEYVTWDGQRGLVRGVASRLAGAQLALEETGHVFDLAMVAEWAGIERELADATAAEVNKARANKRAPLRHVHPDRKTYAAVLDDLELEREGADMVEQDE